MSAHPVVGAMPPEVFLQTFMDMGATLPQAPHVDYSGVLQTKSAAEMCEKFIRATERSNVCPALRLFVTRTKMEKGKVARVRDKIQPCPETTPSVPLAQVLGVDSEESPDLYPLMGARRRPKPRRGAKKKRSLVEYFNFATALLGIEAHHSFDADPFDDHVLEPSNGTPTSSSIAKSPSGRESVLLPSHNSLPPQVSASHRKSSSSNPPCIRKPFDNPTAAGTAACRALMSHAKAQFARQHRVFTFQLILVHRWARLVRWDRSGAVVTRRFDYVANPEHLCEFLWRFSHMTDEQRGWDPSVSVASRTEVARFKTAIATFLRESSSAPARAVPNAQRSLDVTRTFPFWRIQVGNPSSGQRTHLIVNRPFAGTFSLRGRATRAYLAYDASRDKLVFFKDFWRDVDAPLRPEFDTLEQLRVHGVPHVPTVLYGGDVLDLTGRAQETNAQIWARVPDDWRVTGLVFHKYVHHRIVQDIAYPLESVRDERELVQALHDVLCAMSKASEIGILHRDISAKNVMLAADGRGILNDWDHAGTETERAPRVGTWWFMSVRLLEAPDRIHELIDDLEAVFWVLIFSTLKLFPQPDTEFPENLFDYRTRDKLGRSIGGQDKRRYLEQAAYNRIQLNCDALRELISDCGDAWSLFYLRDELPQSRGDAIDELFADCAQDVAATSFWIQKFAAALDKLPKPTPPVKPRNAPTCHGAQSSLPTKRKVRNSGPDDAEPLRRSKRLKNSARP